MLHSNSKLDFKGVIVPVVTPLDKRYRFDRKGMRSLIDHVIKGGVNGIFVLGSCGEYPSFDDDESLQIIESVVEEVNGRVGVYANATRNSTEHTLNIAKSFIKAGVNSLVLTTPFYFHNITETDLVRHFETLAKFPSIVLYNVPVLTKLSITINILERLFHLGSIKGIKDSSGDLDYFTKVARILPVMQGIDNLFLDSMNKGGVGGVPGLANIVPKTFVDMYNLCQIGDLGRAAKLQKELAAMMLIVYNTFKNPQAGVKYCLSCLGICDSNMRPPMAQINRDETRKIDGYLKNFNLC